MNYNNIRRHIMGLLLVLLAFAGPGVTGAAAQTVVQKHGRLQVIGNHVADQAGNPVTLRGMSLYWSQWLPKYYNANTVRWLRDDWKVDVIRTAMAVDSGGYLAQPSVEQAKVETVINAAIANGIYVIVDWHAHDPHPAEAAAFFAKIAQKYGSKPNVIFETWNEPLAQYGWASVIKPYHEQVLKSIRPYSSNLVVAGTRTWSQDVDEAAANRVTDSNTAYTLHFYAATHKQSLRDKAALAMQRGAALFVTEYGTTAANGDLPIDSAETRRWWDWLEANHVSYANWSVADLTEASAALAKNASPDGNWPASAISTSGTLVRNQLRAKAGQ